VQADIEEWLQRQLALAPPLSPAMRDQLAALFSGLPVDDADQFAHYTGEAA
jgi:hypothetical protein